MLLWNYVKTLGAVVAATAVAGAIVWLTPLDSVSAIYMLPVLVAAIRYGTGPAMVAALLGAVMTSLFYPPLFSVLVFKPAQIVDLVTSLAVALTVGPLAGRLRAQMIRATQNERAIRRVYELSSTLAGAADVQSVYRIVADHMSQALNRPAALFVASTEGRLTTVRSPFPHDVTETVRELATLAFPGPDATATTTTVELPQHGLWLLCRLTGTDEPSAIVAVAVVATGEATPEDAATRVRDLLAEGRRSLERLGLSRILDERRLRQRTDALRDMLVESVSHDLRTPLASIMGAASVLATAPPIEAEPSLLPLTRSIEQEARRLDRLIQDVLDLGRIRAGALQPRLDIVDPVDIVNAALDAAAERLRGRRIERALEDELPLVHVDPVLIEQALVNILDNAAKFSPAEFAITIAATAGADGVTLDIRDRGPGLDAGEAGLVFERFHRGDRHADIAGGSGLGLTIAKVFVEANGGTIEALSAGPDQGTTMRLRLPGVAERKERGEDDD